MDHIYETFNEHLKFFLGSTTDVWNEIGVEKEERNIKLLKFITEFKSICDTGLQEEKDVRDVLRQKVLTTQKTISLVSKSLDESQETLPSLQGETLLDQCKILAVILERAQKRRSERVNVMSEVYALLCSLREDLGLPSYSVDFNSLDADLSLKTFELYEQEAEKLAKEKSRRINLIQTLREDIVELISDLCVPIDVSTSSPSTESTLDHILVNYNDLRQYLKCSDDTLSLLYQRKQSLTQEKEIRQEKVKQYAIKITALWERLQISDEERSSFFINNTGLGPHVLIACRNELKRLEAMKAEKLEELILNCREYIKQLWADLHTTEEEKANFTPFWDESFTEGVLDLHEAEIESLKSKIESLVPVLSLLNQRETILQQKKEFDASSADPDRLLSKKRDPGRLLREEKFRKLVAKELPKIESKLKLVIEDWQTKYQQPFIWEGRYYLDELPNEKKEPKKRALASTPKLNSTNEIQSPFKSPSLNKTGSFSRSVLSPVNMERTPKIPKNSLNKTVGATGIENMVSPLNRTAKRF